MGLGEKQQDYQRAVAAVNPQADGYKSPAHRFIDDDCVVVECSDGFIRIDDGQRGASVQCPDCNRSGVPSLPRFKGPVTRYTAEEMAQRREARIRHMRGDHA
jgi:hypothetical protein